MGTNVKLTNVKYNNQEHRIGLKQNKNALKGLTPDDIPNIAPAAAIKEFMKGDENPYFKLQAINYPIKANGYFYQESFFESVLKNLTDHPFPGSKYGHETSWMKRDKTDFILLGGKIESKGNGKGTVFLKNYIPPVGDNGDNTIFIKELKAGMIEFSLVSYTRDERIEKPGGEMVWNVVESLYGERNDAVSINEGAMEQKVSKQSDTGDTPDNNNKGDIMPDDKKLNKTDVLKMLKEMQDNNIEFADIAKMLGAEDQLITGDHIKALAIIKDLEKINCENPVAEITAARKTLADNADAVLSAKLDKEFGPDPKKENLLRQYAGDKYNSAAGETFEAKAEAIKADPIAKQLAAQAADYTENRLGIVDSPDGAEKKENIESPGVNGIPVVED